MIRFWLAICPVVWLSGKSRFSERHHASSNSRNAANTSYRFLKKSPPSIDSVTDTSSPNNIDAAKTNSASANPITLPVGPQTALHAATLKPEGQAVWSDEIGKLRESVAAFQKQVLQLSQPQFNEAEENVNQKMSSPGGDEPCEAPRSPMATGYPAGVGRGPKPAGYSTT